MRVLSEMFLRIFHIFRNIWLIMFEIFYPVYYYIINMLNIKKRIVMMQEIDNDDKKSTLKEESSQGINFLPIWRARCITPYNPELLPSEAVPLREEVNQNHNHYHHYIRQFMSFQILYCNHCSNELF